MEIRKVERVLSQTSLRMDLDVTQKLKDLKDKFSLTSLNSSIVLLLSIYEDLELIDLVLKRDETIVKVNGIDFLRRIKEDWTVKSISWERLIKRDQKPQQSTEAANGNNQ